MPGFRFDKTFGVARSVKPAPNPEIDESLFDPILVCDEPAEGSEVSRGTVINGWAYSPAGIREVSVWLDGRRVGRADIGLEREDAAEAQPEWPGALRSGFRYRLDALPFSEPVESAELTVVAEDGEGRRTEVRRVVRRDRRELLKEKIESQRRELHRMATELRAAKISQRTEQKKKVNKKKQEIFQLKMELRAAEEQRAQGEPVTGALPDFTIIGPTKSGTTYLYHLLTQHPLVEPAAFKELHYFNMFFEEEGIEWYRRCFPAPTWKDGRKTITGEATPEYLVHPCVPERMAEVVPHVRLIALLRNPVERTYSAYHQRVRNGRETLTFEEAVEKALRAAEVQPLAGLDDSRHGHLFNSVYVDHLLRWSRFYSKEQMLVLKSEDFFEHPSETLKPVLNFLDLPDWELEASQLGNKLNKGGYEQAMDPATRRRLEAFFEPHNRRLYDYLGVDFGW